MVNKLTAREEEIMNFFWNKGPLFVKDIIGFWPDPKPHFNTVSTFVRELEAKGYVAHKSMGLTYQYYPVVSRQEYSKRNLRGVIENYFNKSYLNAVSALVKEEDISVDDLQQLIKDIESSANH